LLTLPPKTTVLIVGAVLGYMTVARPGAGLLNRMLATTPLPTGLVPIAAMLVGETLLLGVLLVVVATRGWWRLSTLRPDGSLWPTTRRCRVALAAVVLVLALQLVGLLSRLMTNAASDAGHPSPPPARAAMLALLLVGAMLLVGFNEELLFRGLALGALLRDRAATRPQVYQAVLLTNVLFGLAHLVRHGPIGTRLVLVVTTAAMGVGFTGLRLASGSIWISVLLHGLLNSISLIAVAAVGESAANNSSAWTHAILPLLAILAGVAGVESYLRQHPRPAADHHQPDHDQPLPVSTTI
jgi:membrane protease YdiL (CAAX protease family)